MLSEKVGKGSGEGAEDTEGRGEDGVERRSGRTGDIIKTSD